MPSDTRWTGFIAEGHSRNMNAAENKNVRNDNSAANKECGNTYSEDCNDGSSEIHSDEVENDKATIERNGEEYCTEDFENKSLATDEIDEATTKYNGESTITQAFNNSSSAIPDNGSENQGDNYSDPAITNHEEKDLKGIVLNRSSSAIDNFGNRNKSGIEERLTTNHGKRYTANEEVDYDQLVSAAGEFGLYQVFLIFCTFPFYVFGVFSYFGQLFMTSASPNHWCWAPELANMTALQRRSLAIPLDPESRFGYSQCEIFIANWTKVLESSDRPNETWTRQACQNGWEFNDTEIPYPTITSDLGWVCDKASYPATAQAIFFAGSVLGGFIFGWLSDRFGRIPAAVTSNSLGCIAGVAGIFATSFSQFSICRFLMGVCYDYNMMMTYILVLEFVAPKYRSLMANLPFGIFFSLGATTLPWIAIACGHWKTLGLATSLPMGLALLTPLIVPESPKWLLVKGRVDEAVDQIATVARVNKKEIPLKLIEKFKASASKVEPSPEMNLLDLAKIPVLRNNFICLCIEYMCCMTIFDALVRSLGSLQFDFFMSFTLVSLTECPSLVLISLILDATGRKWLSVLCLLLCCVFSVSTAFVGAGWPSVLCAVAARFAVNMSTNIAIQWGAEILPTPIRGSAVSFIHICGFVASVLSPYIVYLERHVPWLPLVIVGLLALVGAAAAVALPETVGREMPQTFEEAVALNDHQLGFDVPCLKRKPMVKPNGKGVVNPTFEMN